MGGESRPREFPDRAARLGLAASRCLPSCFRQLLGAGAN
jgi:hypothetical protein